MALRVEDAAAVGPADFDAFYAAFEARVRGLIRKRVRSPHRVEDLVQETFMRAHRNAAIFDTSRPAWPWLATIANNLVVDSARRRAAALEDPAEVTRLERADPAADLADHYDRVERRTAIADVLGDLPERQRRVLVLRDVDGLRYDEVAAHEGMSVDTVKSLLKRARGGFRTAYSSIADERGLWGGALVALRALRRRANDSSARVGAWAATMVEGLSAPAAAVAAGAVTAAMTTAVAVGGVGASAITHAQPIPAIGRAATELAGPVLTRLHVPGATASQAHNHVTVGNVTPLPPPSGAPPEAGAHNGLGVNGNELQQVTHVKTAVAGENLVEASAGVPVKCGWNAASAALCAAVVLLPPGLRDVSVGDDEPLPTPPPGAERPPPIVDLPPPL